MTENGKPEGTTYNELFDQMAVQGADTLSLRIKRDPKPGLTFSEGPLDEFITAIQTFVVARIAGRWMERGGADAPGVSDLTAELRLTLDGESRTVGADAQPWFVVDGAARATGQRAVEAAMVTDISIRAEREHAALNRVIGSLARLPDDHLEQVRAAVETERQRRTTVHA